MTKEQARAEAQRAADREGKPVAIFRLNPFSNASWVVRDLAAYAVPGLDCEIIEPAAKPGA